MCGHAGRGDCKEQVLSRCRQAQCCNLGRHGDDNDGKDAKRESDRETYEKLKKKTTENQGGLDGDFRIEGRNM